MEGPKVIARVYDFLKRTIPHISKFPKNQRYTLGSHIEDKLLFLLGAVIEAQYTKRKYEVLRRANLDIEQLRYLFRLSYDLRLINTKTYELSSKYLKEIGAQVGGWIKRVKIEKTPSSL